MKLKNKYRGLTQQNQVQKMKKQNKKNIKKKKKKLKKKKRKNKTKSGVPFKHDLISKICNL